ncbi:schlafen family member 13 [Sorex fumeus]|uniref:schlafen family member 13 n=1 Tax=Sorex fumeus TaxID=62283 RepID=UPI0024ACDDC6|nr:schlafen family member 13 [Sorex fumeus]
MEPKTTMEYNLCSLVVEPFHPDLIINVGEVTLGEHNRKKLEKTQRDQEKKRVQQAACALLNSGGGVIQITMTTEEVHQVELGLDLEGALRELIQSPDLQSFFETKQQRRFFYIFVKSWSSGPSSGDNSPKPRICSLSSNLYYRSGTSVLCMTSNFAFDTLKKKKMAAEGIMMNQSFPSKKKPQDEDPHPESHSPNQVFQTDRFEYGDILPFPESQYVEFKQFSTSNITRYLKNIIPEYISAFANAKGGYLFIGVDDKSKVLGCEKDNVDCNTLERIITESISKLPVVHFCSTQPLVDYETRIAKVFHKETLHGYLCMIQVKPFCCAVFSQDPSSWMVKGNGFCSLTPSEWVDMMMDTNPELSEDFESQLNISQGPPNCKPVYSKKGLEHKKNLQQRLFSVQPDYLQYTPEPLWKELCSEHEGLQELMNNQIFPLSQGVLILSRSWAVDLKLQEKQGVLCDALLIAQNSPPILYTILGEQVADGWSYCTQTAFTLKQKLVNMGGYTGKLFVMPKLLLLHPESNAQSLRVLSSVINYPKSYNLEDIQQMEALLQSLVVVLLSFRSFLSDQLGCEFLNLLTVEQYEVLSKNLRKHRELFIHGLPGTGKTIIALNIIEKIRNVFRCEPKNILYVCENKPLRNFVGKKGICRAETRKTFMADNYKDIQHIIMDEAQNFRDEDGDWFEKAKAITQSEKDSPGILWIFLDYFQTSHTMQSGLPCLSAQNSREELTKVVRNSDEIAKLLQGELDRVKRYPPNNIPPGSLDMLLKANWCSGVKGTLRTENNLSWQQTVSYVEERCKTLFKRGYSPKDVAVLLNTSEDAESYRKSLLRALRKINVVQVSDASDLQSDHIVLDSVRRFSGLERPIVFGILPEKTTILGNLLVCLISRANKQLYILWYLKF